MLCLCGLPGGEVRMQVIREMKLFWRLARIISGWQRKGVLVMKFGRGG